MARKPLPKPKRKPAVGKAPQATPEQLLAKRWCTEIDRYQRGSHTWRERAAKIEKIYLDEHRKEDSSDRHFAIVWANIETMKPATYARRPQAVVSRRWEVDDAGRKAGEVLERCINDTFDLGGIHEVLEAVRDDRLLVSRGTGWVRYEADFEDVEEPAPAGGDEPEGEPDDGAPPRQRVAGERVINEFVHWSDFGHTLARTWPEVSGVWRVVYMTREKVEARKFSNEDAVKRLKYEVRPELADRASGSDADAFEPQTKIHEIWDRANRQVLWLSKDNEEVLESGPPPLKFRNFFPCPKPVFGTKSTRSLLPVPDYRYYQDQAEEIDDLTAKISGLTAWLRLKGFIASGPSSEGGDALQKLLKVEQEVRSKGDNILVPVESWIGFSEKGGAAKVIDWLPLDIVVTALREAINARREIKNDVFELTGLSDILRGETDPNETLGAQELKAQTGSRRISTVQRDLARFARDVAELNGEVIANVFSPETMAEMSGMDLTTEPPPELLAEIARLKLQLQPPMPMPAPAVPGQVMVPGAAPISGQPPTSAPQPPPDPAVMKQLEDLQEQLQEFETNKQVIAILRDERTRGFRIDIETDSTVEPDEQAEKARRVEFLQAVGQFMMAALPVLQAQPKMLPVIKEMLLFLVRGFRAGRGLEDVIESTMSELEQAAAQPHPPQPDPRLIKVQADAQLKSRAQDQAAALEQRGQDVQAALEQRGQDLHAASEQHKSRTTAALQALEALNNAQPVGPGVVVR